MRLRSRNIPICLTVSLALSVGSLLSLAGVSECKHLRKAAASELFFPEPAGSKLLTAGSGDTVCVYFEDFQDGASGWVAKDAWAQADTFWHREAYGALPPDWVMRCSAWYPCWENRPGHGNRWRQHLSKEFVLGPSPVIQYRIKYYTEDDHDFLYFDISNDGGATFYTERYYHGESGGYVTDTVPLTGFAYQTVIFRFRFESDEEGSDEDGYYDNQGKIGVIIDWVWVTGFTKDDFNSGTDGWVASVGLPQGTYSFRLEETPACEPDPTTLCDDYCWTWVAYDSTTGDFPFEAGGGDIELTVESPVIDIPDDGTAYFLEFDIYIDQPRTNYVLYTWQVAMPPIEDGGRWEGPDVYYYGTSGMATQAVYINEYRCTQGVDQMQIRFLAADYYYEEGGPPGDWSGGHNAGPMFDNVRVRVVGTSDPGIGDCSAPSYCGDDTDGDGVFGSDDVCSSVDASDFDRNGDGCVDDGAGGGHVEYWGIENLTPGYRVSNAGGSVCPDISDASDFIAIERAFQAWIWGDIEFGYLVDGLTGQPDARAMDEVNLVTFWDPEWDFGPYVIAVGLTTSFVEPTWFSNEWWRPGEILDSDIIFNPDLAVGFRTDTDGPPQGMHIQSVTTHEVGHFMGLSHSPVRSSTMFYVLQPGDEAASIEPDDSLAMFKAYGSAYALTSSGRLTGTITDSYTSNPLPGAAVFAIEAASGDTIACEYTLPDGTYSIIGLSAGDYYIGIHPLDGTSAVGYMTPGYVNDLIASTANTEFIPESWDSAESQYDEAADRDVLTVVEGFETVADLVTNIDDTPPAVTAVTPDSSAGDVSIDTSVLVSFSERINTGSLQGNFSLTDSATAEFVPGNAASLNDDSLVAFIPLAELAFSTTYELRLEPGIEDMVGNSLADTFVTYFTTEEEPDVSLGSLSPSKGVVGMVISLNGKGFDPEPANNTVYFDSVTASISDASATQLVVTVPEGATSGQVIAVNHTQGLSSNDLQFTVLTADEVPKGFHSDLCALSATPRDVAVLPDGNHVFVATDAGAEVADTDPASPGYMTATVIPVSGGLSNIASGPAGNRVYAISKGNQKFYRLNSTPGSMGLLSEKAIGAGPRGIVIHPRGHRAFIPTDEGDIQIWDIEEASPTFNTQIGYIPNVDPNLRGELATSPDGNLLLGLTGTGRMLVANLDSNKVTQTVTVGTDPQDLAIEPLGNRAYVCDEWGRVSIVSLDDFGDPWKVRTGGALQGISVTPAGSFAMVVDRELNRLSAIDLRSTSSGYLSVVATVQLPINPVDIELSPDGDYAFTISEAEEYLVATTLGVGPSLATLSRRAGPVLTKLVLAGSGFSADTSATVSFGGVLRSPERLTDSSITVMVPGSATSCEVAVVTEVNGRDLTSNKIYYEVLEPTADGMLRRAGVLPGTPAPASDGGSVLQASPDGKYVLLGDQDGGLHVLNTDGASGGYHQYIGSYGLDAPAGDIVIPPDGNRAFVVVPDSSVVLVIGTDRLSQDFLSLIATVDFTGIAGSSISRAAVSPDGTLLLVSDPGYDGLHFVDVQEGSPTAYQITGSLKVPSGSIGEMAFHPSGLYAYFPTDYVLSPLLDVLDTDPLSPTYGTVIRAVTLPGGYKNRPVALSFTPSGRHCLVLVYDGFSPYGRTVVMLHCIMPNDPAVSSTLTLPATTVFTNEHIDVSPMGDRAVACINQEGLFNIEIHTSPDSLALIQQAGDASHHLTTADIDYSHDASKFYCLSESSDSLIIYDFSDASTFAIYSGDGQTGVVGEALSQPLKVKVWGTGGAVPGVPVSFTVTSGGGIFAGNDSTEQSVSTDADGFAKAVWILGPDLGAQTVRAEACNLSGSPLDLSAEGIADPLTLPLAVVSVTPDSGATGISVASAMQAAFSRPVKASSISDTTFYLHAGDHSAVPAVTGFADEYRKVSLSPLSTLDPSTIYWIEMTTGILDENDGPLSASRTSSFGVQSPPDLVVGSIRPISGPEGADVVLSGAGFSRDPAQCKVYFRDLEAYVASRGTDFITARVPEGALSCSVLVVQTVSWPPDTSNPIAFKVIPPYEPPASDLSENISTASPTRSLALTPDGSIAYAVSPDGNTVCVIDLDAAVQITSVAVGENPVAVTVDPGGTFAYVANYLDGTVSVIDAYSGSPNYNKVVDVFAVGIGPTDLAVTPDGDRLVVATAVSGGLSIVDTDYESDTYRSVVSSISTGAGSRTVAITPDGGLIYIGTDTGYTILSAVSFGVVSSIATGSGSRTIAITPDGGLLVVLTTEGVINIYDIQKNSATQNQVVATLSTGSGTSTFAISPDGGHLYMIQEAGDAIVVGVIVITTGQGVMANGAGPGPFPVAIVTADTLFAGEDPSAIVFDPSGSGDVIVANAGDYTISVFSDDQSGTEEIAQLEPLKSYPNPFRHSTTIRFAIPRPAQVHLAIYDVRGRLVRTVLNEQRQPGIHSLQWSGTDSRGMRVASGIYFMRLTAGECVATRKMIMLR